MEKTKQNRKKRCKSTKILKKYGWFLHRTGSMGLAYHNVIFAFDDLRNQNFIITRGFVEQSTNHSIRIVKL